MGMRSGLFVVLACMSASVAGQGYPIKAVRIVVPYPPGGGTDIVARPVAQKLSERWGQSVVIDNRGGATGMIGTELVAKAPPDGYTILFSASPEIVINLHLFRKMAYDPMRDLAAVSNGAFTPIIWVTHPSLPAANMRDFVALSKRGRAQVNYSTSGLGSPHHVAAEWFKLLTKTDLVHVPYKGGGPQMTDQLGGHTISGVFTLPVATPHVRSGKLKGLAVTTAKRSPAVPEVPTLVEQGYAIDVANWFGVSMPAGTPREIVNKVSADVGWAISLPDVRARLVDQGYEPAPNTPEQFRDFIAQEIAKYRKIIADTGIRLEN